MHPEKFRLDEMVAYRPLFIFTWAIFGKPCQMARPFLKIKM